MLKNRKRIFVLLLGVLMATSVAMAACQEQQPTPTCTAHSDANGDGKCDNCGIQVGLPTEPTVEIKTVEVEFSVHNQYGVAMEGAILTIQDDLGGEPVTVTVDADGVAKCNLPEGDYYVMAENLPDGHFCGNVSFTVTADMGHVTLDITDNTPNGTPERPFFISDPVNSFDFNAQETFHFEMRAGEGRALIINNAQNLVLTYNGETIQPDANGQIILRVNVEDPRTQVAFQVTNLSDSGLTVELNLKSDPGTLDNPFAAEIGKTIAVSVKEGQAIYYAWTATKDCTLTVASGSAKNNISMMNKNTSHATAQSEGEASVSLDKITAGDEILIIVGVVPPVEGETETIDFTLSIQE